MQRLLAEAFANVILYWGNGLINEMYDINVFKLTILIFHVLLIFYCTITYMYKYIYKKYI